MPTFGPVRRGCLASNQGLMTLEYRCVTVEPARRYSLSQHYHLVELTENKDNPGRISPNWV